MINKENEFEFGNLRNKLFDIVVRFYREEGSDYSSYASLFSGDVPYTIDVELKDQENKIIKKDTINQNSGISTSHANEFFEWKLVLFDAEKGKKYKLEIGFHSDNKFFDKMAKEIYVEEIYDSASYPWWYLFQCVFLIIFIITLLPILIIGLILWRRKRA